MVLWYEVYVLATEETKEIQKTKKRYNRSLNFVDNYKFIFLFEI